MARIRSRTLASRSEADSLSLAATRSVAILSRSCLRRLSSHARTSRSSRARNFTLFRRADLHRLSSAFGSFRRKTSAARRRRWAANVGYVEAMRCYNLMSAVFGALAGNAWEERKVKEVRYALASRRVARLGPIWRSRRALQKAERKATMFSHGVLQMKAWVSWVAYLRFAREERGLRELEDAMRMKRAVRRLRWHAVGRRWREGDRSTARACWDAWDEYIEGRREGRERIAKAEGKERTASLHRARREHISNTSLPRSCRFLVAEFRRRTVRGRGVKAMAAWAREAKKERMAEAVRRDAADEFRKETAARTAVGRWEAFARGKVEARAVEGYAKGVSEVRRKSRAIDVWKGWAEGRKRERRRSDLMAREMVEECFEGWRSAAAEGRRVREDKIAAATTRRNSEALKSAFDALKRRRDRSRALQAALICVLDTRSLRGAYTSWRSCTSESSLREVRRS